MVPESWSDRLGGMTIVETTPEGMTLEGMPGAAETGASQSRHPASMTVSGDITFCLNSIGVSP